MPQLKGLEVRFDPVNTQQRSFMESRASRVLFSGAFGAGKTMALTAKGLQLSIEFPGNFGLICRKVRSTLAQTTLKTFLDRVCPPQIIADHNKAEGLIKLTNGSQILFGGLDDPLKLGSLELGWAGIDEAIETKEDDWTMLEGRLRLPGVHHQIFAATNPGPPTHYLYTMFFKQKRGEVYQVSSLDNPELPQDYKERLLEFEGTYRERYVLGRWVGLEGLVYSMFNDNICLVPRFEVPLSWPVYSGHDFGLANPAALFYAMNPGTGEAWAFREYCPGGGRSIYDHVQEFKAITKGYNVMRRVGGSHGEEEIRQGYSAQGWHISEPIYSRDVNYQIKKVQALHRLNKVYVFNDLANYIREKFSFIFKKGSDEIENPERFHCMAAERYVLSDFAPETVITKTGSITRQVAWV